MADRDVLEFNGSVFERTIAKYLASRYPGAILVPDRELYSHFLEAPTQIDLMMIHEKGVFIIEAKGWKSWIRGSYNEAKWCGMGSFPNVLEVYSPVTQNFIHMRALRNAIRRELGKEPIQFNSVVCFPDTAVLDTPCENVVSLSRLGLWIDKAMIRDGVSIDPQEYLAMVKAVTTVGRKRE